MKEKLDEYLCKTYPKMFVQRYMSEMETCMCWGFACGDGWFNILDQLCGNIQHHIDWKEKQHNWSLEWNKEHPDEPREISKLVPQVVVTQVKEKFGTLRFYYDGGDDYISGMVTMAESMSGVTCEECGSSAKTSGADPEKGITGWVHTTCLPCQAKRKTRQAEFVVDSLKNDIL